MAIIGRPRGAAGTRRDIVAEIERLAEFRSYTAAEIHRELEAKFGKEATPSDRTVRDIVQRLAIQDSSGAWSPTDLIEGLPVRAVLDVLHSAAVHSHGRVRSLTRNEARFIGAVHQAAPDLDPLNRWMLARTYMRRVQDKQTTEDLDLYVAFQPWSGPTAVEQYVLFIDEAGIELMAPSYLPGVPTTRWVPGDLVANKRSIEDMNQWVRAETEARGGSGNG